MPATRPGTATSGSPLGGLLALMGGLCLLLIVVAAAGVFGGGNIIQPTAACAGEGDDVEAPSEETKEQIPENYLRLYQQAAEAYRIPWQILAAIGDIETDHGRSPLPGVTSGENSAGAGGPMQFLSGTWDAYGVDGDHDGDRDRYDPADAIPSAANYLVASNIRTSIHDAIFAYNHAEWYVADVISRAQGYGWSGDGTGGIPEAFSPGSASGPNTGSGGSAGAAGDEAGQEELISSACGGQFPSGPAQLQRAVELTSPQRYEQIPPEFTNGQFEEVDARILPNVIWIARTYHLIITQGRGGKQTGSPSVSHNYGTAVDMVPADGNTQEIWDQSAGRLAADLGWIPSCGGSGSRPACPLIPAIRFVGYDGYRNHGSPRTCSGGCPPHIHVSWEADPAAVYDGNLGPPLGWVLVFPSPGADAAGLGGGERSGGASAASTSGGGASASTAAGSGENGPAEALPPDETLVVGDSLAVGTGPHLREQLGDTLTVDALTSRSSTAGLSALRSGLSDDHAAVVFDLGTNDPSATTLRDNLREAARLVGHRCLVVASINHPGSATAFNDVIAELADTAAGVELVDWHAMTQNNPSLLASDGIHATEEGYARRGSAMLSALGRC